MILDDAKRTVTSDRRADYGPIQPNMVLIASWWGDYLRARHGEGVPIVTPDDIPVLMILMKVARHATGKNIRDTWIDIAGYAQLAAICAGDDVEGV